MLTPELVVIFALLWGFVLGVTLTRVAQDSAESRRVRREIRDRIARDRKAADR